MEELIRDVNLIFDNAMAFNGVQSYFFYEASWMKTYFNALVTLGEAMVKDAKETRESLNGIMMSMENDANSLAFRHMVKDKNYLAVVKEPMCLDLIRKKIGQYTSSTQMLYDFRLILKNCILYNGAPSYETPSAIQFSRPCLAMMLHFYELYFDFYLKLPKPERPGSHMLPKITTKLSASGSNGSVSKILEASKKPIKSDPKGTKSETLNVAPASKLEKRKISDITPSEVNEDLKFKIRLKPLVEMESLNNASLVRAVKISQSSANSDNVSKLKVSMVGDESKPQTMSLNETRLKSPSMDSSNNESSFKIKLPLKSTDRVAELKANDVNPIKSPMRFKDPDAKIKNMNEFKSDSTKAAFKFSDSDTKIKDPEFKMKLPVKRSEAPKASLSTDSLFDGKATPKAQFTGKGNTNLIDVSQVPASSPHVDSTESKASLKVQLPVKAQYNPNSGKFVSVIFNPDFALKTLNWIRSSDPNRILENCVVKKSLKVTPSISLYRSFYEFFLSDDNFSLDSHWFQSYVRFGVIRTLPLLNLDSIEKKFGAGKSATRSNISFIHEIRRLLSVSLTEPYHTAEFKLALQLSYEFEAKVVEEQCLDVLLSLKNQFPSYYQEFRPNQACPSSELILSSLAIGTSEERLSTKSIHVLRDKWLGLFDFEGSYAWPSTLFDPQFSSIQNSEVYIKTRDFFWDIFLSFSKKGKIRDYFMTFLDGSNHLFVADTALASSVDPLYETTVHFLEPQSAPTESLPEKKFELKASVPPSEGQTIIKGFQEIEKLTKKISANIMSKAPQTVGLTALHSSTAFVLSVRQLLFFNAFVRSLATSDLPPSDPFFVQNAIFSKAISMRAEFDMLIEEQVIAASPLYIHPILRHTPVPFLLRARKATEHLKLKLEMKANPFMPFYRPVHPSEFSLDDYFTKVPFPVDLTTCKRQLYRGMFFSEAMFLGFFQLAFENTRIYHANRNATTYLIEQSNVALDRWKGIWSKAVRDYPSGEKADPFKTKVVLQYDETVVDNVYVTRAIHAELSKQAAAEAQTISKRDAIASVAASNNPFAWLNYLIKHFPEFAVPVDLNLYPTYLNFVREPMDLKKIQKKLNAGVYDSIEEVKNDVILIIENCKAFNPDELAYIRVKCADMKLKFDPLIADCIRSPGTVYYMEGLKAQAKRKASNLGVKIVPSGTASQSTHSKVLQQKKEKSAFTKSVHYESAKSHPNLGRVIQLTKAIRRPLSLKTQEIENQVGKIVRQSIVDFQKKQLCIVDEVMASKMMTQFDPALFQVDLGELVKSDFPTDEEFDFLEVKEARDELSPNFASMDVEAVLFQDIAPSFLNQNQSISLHSCAKQPVILSLEISLPSFEFPSSLSSLPSRALCLLEDCARLNAGSDQIFLRQMKRTIPATSLFPLELDYEALILTRVPSHLLYGHCNESEVIEWGSWFSKQIENLRFKNSADYLNGGSMSIEREIQGTVVGSPEYYKFRCLHGLLLSVAEKYNSSEVKVMQSSQIMSAISPLPFLVHSDSIHDADPFNASNGVTLTPDPLRALEWDDRGFYQAATLTCIDVLPAIAFHFFMLK